MRVASWAALTAAVLTLAACSDPLAQQVGTTTQQQDIPAVVVSEEDDGSVIELTFGQSVILGDLGVPMDAVYIESDDTAIVYPVQPGDGRGAAGLVAVGEGAARVTVWESFPTGKAQVPTLVFEVLVAPSPDPATP